MTNWFETDLDQCAANHQPMTPISFLQRAASVFAHHPAIIYGESVLTYAAFWRQSCQLASVLSQRGIGRGDAVSVLLSNTPPMLVAHHGVPMAGAVLHSMNTRLDAATIAFQLDHAETKILIVDREFSAMAKEALAQAKVKPLVIDYDDPQYPADAPAEKGPRIGSLEYDAFIANGDINFEWIRPQNEWDAIALNYTSGTTGNPKGVVYHHRACALMAYNNTIHAAMAQHSVYLWTLPMFHCNGWCYPWTLALTGSTHVCLRWVRAGAIYDQIAAHKVSHLCGAPVVMATIVSATNEEKRDFDHRVNFNVAAAPPPESVLAAMDDAGFQVTHVYGLTEVYGPAVVNVWNEQWDGLPADERASLKARQGVSYAGLEDLQVLDPTTLQPVPADGETIGEIMMQGNIVMKGYLKSADATEEAFVGGYFHSGDLAVMHPDGYVQIKDRSKDIIISGGENISSIDVENAIYKHPDVAAVAVVALAHEKWGETPAAFIEAKDGSSLTEDDVARHCKEHLARFQRPGAIYFEELPKTSTGKIEKFKLRERVIV